MENVWVITSTRGRRPVEERVLGVAATLQAAIALVQRDSDLWQADPLRWVEDSGQPDLPHLWTCYGSGESTYPDYYIRPMPVIYTVERS